MNKKIFEKMLLVFDTIVLVFLIVITYRICILNRLEKIGLEYAKKTNYKIQQEFFNEGYITKTYGMNIGNKSLSNNISYNINSNTKHVIIDYVSNGENYTLINTDYNKYYYYKTVDNIEYNLEDRKLQLSFQEKLIIAVLGNIQKDKYDFKDAYYIKLNEITAFGNEIIVDKETGLVVEQSEMQEKLNVNPTTGRYEKEKYKDIQKFKYEFDTVKDEDIQKPDLSGYEKKNYND